MTFNLFYLRKLATLALLALLPHSALAGLPPTSVQGQSDTSATTKFNFQVPYNQYTNLGGIKALLETGNHNLLLNPNFENSTATTSWTATTATGSSESTNVADGLKSYHLAFSSQTGNMAQSVTPTIQMSGVNMVASCAVKTSMTTIQLCALTAGNEISCNNVASNNTWARVSVNFVGPSSGSVGVDVKTSASGTGDVYIDDCYVGVAAGFNVAQFSQATLVASGFFPTTGSCTVNRTNTALGSFSTTAACPGPTVELNPGPGTLQTTDVDQPTKFTINNLPPGNYMVYMAGPAVIATSTQVGAMAFNDGTTTFGQTAVSFGSAEQEFVVTGFINYTTTANRTFELFESSAANAVTINIGASNKQVYFAVIRFPSTVDTIYNAGQAPASWSGYHDNTCSWARTSTSYGDPTADTTCALAEVTNRNFGTVSSYLSGSDKLPGIVFTPPRAGRYYVCALPKIAGATLASVTDLRLWDGTTTIAEGQMVTQVTTDQETLPICGIYNAASSASTTLSLQSKASSGAITIAANGSTNRSAVEWSIFELDYGVNAPLLAGAVISPSTGAEKTIRATMDCSSSSKITHQDGSAFTSIGNIASGKCSITILAATFSSTAFDCNVTPNGTAVTSITQGIVNNKTSTNIDVYFALISSGSSTIAAATSVTFDITCRGPN